MQSATLTSRADSVTLKAVMAVTGALMMVWLTLHMLGNLTVFAGAEVMNEYALKLRATGLVWPMRVGLAALFLAHVGCAVLTAQRGRAARPQRYEHRPRHRASTATSRTMRLTGALLFLYIAYHVATMYGVGHPAFIESDVHHNMLALMRLPWHLALSLSATALVSMHLAHGMRSSLQSLGVLLGKRERLVQRSLNGWAFVVTLGFTLAAVAPIVGWA